MRWEGSGSVLAYRQVRQQQWLDKFHELKAFYARHGHFVILRHEPDNRELIALQKWLTFQRSCYRAGELRPDREAMLKGLGVQLDTPGRRKKAR
jgi:hypothetical protein